MAFGVNVSDVLCDADTAGGVAVIAADACGVHAGGRRHLGPLKDAGH
jgi:hypothetical protein